MLEIDDLEVGRLVENCYTLIQELGDGGFALVWEVADVQTNNDRKAIKFLVMSQSCCKGIKQRNQKKDKNMVTEAVQCPACDVKANYQQG